TCGYGESPMEQEVCGRWLAFSCFTPIMEVGPTRNVGFWNLPRTPSYDAELIAIWRLYARVHQRLAEYSYAQAKIAQQTGIPVIRSLLLVDPKAPEAWRNWQTYLYGPDLLSLRSGKKDRANNTFICRKATNGAMPGIRTAHITAAKLLPSMRSCIRSRSSFA